MNVHSLPHYLNFLATALIVRARVARAAAPTPYVHLLPRLNLTFVFAGFCLAPRGFVADSPA